MNVIGNHHALYAKEKQYWHSAMQRFFFALKYEYKCNTFNYVR